MKTHVRLLTLIIILLLHYNPSFSAKYYFSSSGDDSRTAAQAQNPDTPWRSISKLNAVMRSLQPGDEVLFRRGDTFYGTINVSQSGSSGRPLVFGAYGSGPKPIITSLVALNNWNHVGGGVYESHHSSLPSEVNIVLLNDAMQEKGRFPNRDAANGGYLTFTATNGFNNITAHGLSGNWTGGEVVIRKSHFTIDSYPILSHLGNIISFVKGTDTYNPKKGFGYFIQGHPNTLDKEGEWYYNRSTKRLRVHFGSKSPSSFKVEVATLKNLVTNTRNSGDVVFDNIHFRGANQDAFYVLFSKNFKVQNSQIEFAGESGFFAQEAPHVTIENTEVLSSNGNGILLHNKTPNAIIKNNVIRNTNLIPGLGKNGNSGLGISTTADNNLIENNQVINTGYIGIRFSGNSTVVKNNFIENFCLIKDDGAGIYTWTGASNRDFRDRKVVGNVILNGAGAVEGTPVEFPQVEGIYLDDNASGVEISDNTVANTSGKGIYIHNARNLVVKNNTFYNNGVQLRMSHDALGSPIRNTTITDNIFFSKLPEQLTGFIGSSKNDIKDMGTFDRNFYVRPFEDNQSIFVQSIKGGGRVSEYFHLDGWKKSYGKDNSSKSSPVLIPPYKILRENGANKYTNGTFDNQRMASAGLYGNRADISWAQDKLDEGSLRVKGNAAFSFITMSIGSLKKSTYYVLRFTAVANKDLIIKPLLMQSNSPQRLLAPKAIIKIDEKVGKYEAVFFVEENESNASLRFEAEGDGHIYWLDNITLNEVEARVNNPDDYILFEYNAENKEKTIRLDGTYVDAKNVPHSGNISLPPFSSKVLIKTSDVSSPAEPDNQAPSISILTPSNNEEFQASSNIEIKVDVKDADGSIGKVEYFSGNEKIGSATKAPYSFLWENVSNGEYVLSAKAIDNKSLSATSQSVKVKVLTSGSIPDKVDTEAPRPPSNAAGFSLYLNAGSDEDVPYKGQVFLGDRKFPSYYNSSHTARNERSSSEPLYQSERNSSRLNYRIPVPNGTYTVKTYHNEQWWGGNGPSATMGRRVFDVMIEGQVVKADFDMYVESKNQEITLTFHEVEVKDGQLNLDLLASSDRASISGLSIEGSDVAKSPDQNGFTFYLNTGSGVDVTYDGRVFKGDKNYRSYYNSSFDANNAKASDDELFQTERNAARLYYSIPVPNGTYQVKTYHNEIWWGHEGPPASKGARVFSISMEGQLLKNNFDMYVETGNKQTVLTFSDIEVEDGVLNLDMVSSQDRASISGIAIENVATAAHKIGQSGFSLHLNTGTADDYVLDGRVFQGDRKFRSYFNHSFEGYSDRASGESLYQSERNAQALRYSIPVPNGIYTVETYHNEIWWGYDGPSAAMGRRVFDISLEGRKVKENVDLYRESKNQEIMFKFTNVEVKDGILNLDMVASRDRASISGISIYSSAETAHLRTSFVEEQTLELPAGMIETESKSSEEIKLYPNPASVFSTLTLSRDVDLNDILIHDMNGQLIRRLDPSFLNTMDGGYLIPLDGVPQGVYLVSVVGRKEIIKQIRLIVTQ